MDFSFSFSIQDFQNLGIDQDSALWEFTTVGNPYLAGLLSGLIYPSEELPAWDTGSSCLQKWKWTVFANVQICAPKVGLQCGFVQLGQSQIRLDQNQSRFKKFLLEYYPELQG